MKFIVSTHALLKQLQLINGVISGNAVIPILEYFLFEVNEGKLTITGTDLEVSMRGSVKVEAKEDGSVAVPARIILDTLKTLPEQPLTFSINADNHSIELTSDNGKYKLAGENPDDFPKFPILENETSFKLPVNILDRGLMHTLFGIGTDELRPAMTGLLFDMTENDLRLVSTDGNKLVKYQRSDIKVESGDKFIIPKKALSLLKNSLPDEEGLFVEVSYNKLNVLFAFKGFEIICRLIDEKFPNYGSAIPQDNPNELIINRLEILNSLRRISIFANKTTYQAQFGISGSELQVSAKDIDFSNEAHERLECEYKGNDMDIAFSAKFLVEMLSIISSDEVRIELSDPGRPGLLKPLNVEEFEDIIMLLMPIVIKTEHEEEV